VGVGYFFERWVRRRFYERHVAQIETEGKARCSEIAPGYSEIAPGSSHPSVPWE